MSDAPRCTHVAVYVGPDGRTRKYPMQENVPAPEVIHDGEGTEFTLLMDMHELPPVEVRAGAYA